MKKITSLLTLVLLSAIIFSCEKQEWISEEQPETASLYISKDNVLNVLKSSSNVYQTTTKSSKNPFSTVKNVTTIDDSHGIPACYVVNYSPEGFVIISAEDKIKPILAVSEKGSFDLPLPLNSGIIDWLSCQTIGIGNVRNADITRLQTHGLQSKLA